MNKIMRWEVLFLFAFFLALNTTGMLAIIPPAYADIPDVTSIVPSTSGADTILSITIRHALPTSTHYIYRLEVDVAGTINVVDLGPPQTGPTFVVQYNMGSLTTTPTVRARAFCIVHGVGPWSQQVVVSEFSTLNIILILAVVSVAILLIRFKFKGLGKRAFIRKQERLHGSNRQF